ncbi:MAG: hypothetical protein H6730_06370 [Deltaproteobacteria bacterium]|nr:hypothetical protein [Deltaproteobacteria bacterium]
MARAKGGRIWRSGAAQGLRQGPRRCYPNLVRVGGWALGLCLAASLGGIREAGAQSMSLTAKTIYHAYQINLWPGQDLGYRDLNRFYTTLDVGGWSLGPGGDIDAVMSLRYDTDFGTGFHIDTPAQVGIPATDQRNDLDLIFAYVDWKNIVKGRLHGRLGRQVLVDDLAWYSLDGVNLTFIPWRSGRDNVTLSAYVGMPVRFDVVFSSEPFLNDGTQVKDNTAGLAFGGTARATLFGGLDLSVSYRQEVAFRKGELEAFRNDLDGAAASAGSIGLQESRLGASAGYTIQPLHADVYGSLIWDAITGAIEQARAGVGYDPIRGVHVQGEYLRSRPRFAGDSIFNWFNIFAYDRGRLELSLELIPGLTVQGGYLLQVFGGGTTATSGADFPGSDLSHGPSGGVSYRSPRFGAGVHGEAATNGGGSYAYGGNYRSGWAWADVSFLERTLVADARVSLTTVQTDWYAGNDAGQVAPADTTVNVALGGRANLFDFLSARVMFVKNFGAALEGSYRIYSELAVRY